MNDLDPRIAAITERIRKRSATTRQAYLDLIHRQRDAGTNRGRLSCGNLAHGFAASGEDKPAIRSGHAVNIGIVTAYNDMLSAHHSYDRYPEQIKVFAREVGATAQVAGGVPAMCDGVTQGQAGMELSLFSRDTIALSTAVALSHAMFEGALMLGICDKIVPGLFMGAMRFGHLPTVFVPGGPMPSGLPNKEKVRIRQLYAEGKVGRDELLESESQSYHTTGTCTFYGTANSNQMMMEAMGLHVPNSAFVQPRTKLRQELTRAAVHRVAEIAISGDDYRPMGEIIDERAIVNAAVALMATGGSTNHAIHLPAMARAGGMVLDWADLNDISEATPLIARVYPNGSGDVNAFQVAGGTAYIIKEMLGAGLMHGDIPTIWAGGMAAYMGEPTLTADDQLTWSAVGDSRDETMLAPVTAPFQPNGGMRLLDGNLGRAVIKVSAVEQDRWIVEAPARVFSDQDQVIDAFKAGELERDVVVVVRFQGPQANGMPELHKLTPSLGVLQDRGFKVALVTDGRMSGASGKVPACIHLVPEALDGGPVGKVRDGDIVRVDAVAGTIDVIGAPDFTGRPVADAPPAATGVGRELFALFRHGSDGAERGASPLLSAMENDRR
ncbi:phosphogluconate dehydratase [Sphingomonas jejuensis]|uniref:Phosphogluconate dehydratase n=1 Tax=Sphingomonas jejuensis TaxID=904715 RepID=A0ABX0XIC6_9SPHN|nr:phosphogluconate dehydratase [Sphingomonas jejuensis]NJC33093.1 phosphogluconate dehydratase [Sphingomonas jejuensis]